MTQQYLDRLAELEAKATPGPWRADTLLGGRKPIVGTPEVDGEGEIIFEGYDRPDCELAAMLRNHARELIAAARRSQWIPVTERLPEPQPRESEGYVRRVLVWCQAGCFFDAPQIGWYSHAEKRWHIDGSSLSWTVTHWMPLPERPKQANAERSE